MRVVWVRVGVRVRIRAMVRAPRRGFMSDEEEEDQRGGFVREHAWGWGWGRG